MLPSPTHSTVLTTLPAEETVVSDKSCTAGIGAWWISNGYMLMEWRTIQLEVLLVLHSPFLRTGDQQLAGWNAIFVHDDSLLRPLCCQQHPGTSVAVTVRSSIKALIGSWRVPELQGGPLHSTSAALTSIVMVRANSITNMVQPVMMPFPGSAMPFMFQRWI